MKRRVFLHRDESGWWIAEVPSLPGCNTQGETREDALDNIDEAIELYLEYIAEKGEENPIENSYAEVVEV